MRKRLLAPLSAAVCLTVALVAGCGSASSTGASSTAAASGSSKAAQPAMNYTSPNGTEYEWQPAGIYYTANSDRILIDYCAYMLEHPLQSNGDGVIFASLDDLTRIYAPDFTVTRDGDAISATHAGVTMEVTLGSTSAKAYGGSVTLDAAPYEADSTVFVPLKSFMVSGFGKTDVSNGKFYGLGNNGDFQVSKDDVYNLKMFFRGKTVGKSYYTYWNDEIGKLEPVAVYIPTSYDPSTPNKMVVQLHGAGSTYAFADQDRVRPLMKEAEQRGYIVVWPGSYCKLCNFGASIPPAGMVPITPDTDLTNPQGHSAGKLADIALAGSNVQDKETASGEPSVPTYFLAVFQQIIFVSVTFIIDNVSFSSVAQRFHVFDIDVVFQFNGVKPSAVPFFITCISAGDVAAAIVTTTAHDTPVQHTWVPVLKVVQVWQSQAV